MGVIFADSWVRWVRAGLRVSQLTGLVEESLEVELRHRVSLLARALKARAKGWIDSSW